MSNLVDNKMDAKTVLQKLSENGRCLLSGATIELIYTVVDGDVSNILPSNIMCISKKFLDNLVTCTYDADLWNFKVIFDSFGFLEEYNRSILEHLNSQDDGFVNSFDSDISRIIELYDYLARKHVKGLFKIICGKYTIDRIQYQNYLVSSLARSQSSSIII